MLFLKRCFLAVLRSVLPEHYVPVRLRKHAPRWVSRYGEGSPLTARSAEPFPVQIDGDYRGMLADLRVEVRPGAVQIIVPQGGDASTS